MSSRKVCAVPVTGRRTALVTGMDTCMILAGAYGVGCCVVIGGR